MVYKSLNGVAPDYMHSMFVNRDSVNPYSLRNTENKLAVPKPRTNYGAVEQSSDWATASK